MNLLQKIRGAVPAVAEPASLHAETINPIHGLTLEAKLVKLSELGKLCLSFNPPTDWGPSNWWMNIEISARGGTLEFKVREKATPLEAVDALIEKVIAAGLPL